MIYKTPGIILRRKNLAEADRILTIFTQKRGKVKAVAKGVRWLKSHLAGHLELFCLSDLILAEGKNLDTIIGAELIKSYPKLRADLARTNQAYYLAEITDKLTVEADPHSEIFQLLKKGLDILEEDLSLIHI